MLRSRLVLVAEVDSQLLGGHTDEAVWVHLPVVEFMVAGFLGHIWFLEIFRFKLQL